MAFMASNLLLLHMKNFERTGGQTMHSPNQHLAAAEVLQPSAGAAKGEELVENSSAESTQRP